ncbi:MlaD family protein [Actinocorallia sp. B10E7]|uniref:MlaD family protein n=1 Tax=Actinocorallia sp. B10E7 TaxID=3153558 RepID=UPI00325DE39B
MASGRSSDARTRGRRSALLQLVAFLALTGTLTSLIASQIARLDFSETYEVTAVFDDVTGLLEGDKVKIAGAPVGQVGSIRVRDGRAEVELKIRAEHRVPRDSQAAIRWRDAISQRVVYLLPGTSTERLRDGDRIRRTRSVVDIGDLVNRLEPLTRGLDSGKVNEILMSVYLALDGNEDDIARLLTNVDKLSSTIATRLETLKTMLDDYSTVTGIIAKRDEQIAKAADDLVTLSQAFVDNRKLVDDAVKELSAMLRTTDRVLGENSDDLAQVVDRLSRVTDGTQRNLDPLLETITVMGPKLQRLYDTFNDGQYVTGTAPCVTLSPGPCPFDPKLVGSTERPARSSESLRKLILGGE